MKKRRLRYTISMLASIVIIAGVFFCLGYKTAYDRIGGSSTNLDTQTFYASILSMKDHTINVKGMEVNDINFRGCFTFSVGNETKITWRYAEISLEDLEAGDNIAITFSGEIMESNPAQITQVQLIQLLDDEIH